MLIQHRRPDQVHDYARVETELEDLDLLPKFAASAMNSRRSGTAVP
jgi:hypothetical protein